MHSFQHTPLVCWTGYGIGPRIKGNPGPCWIQEPGLARRMTAPRTVASGGLTFDPGQSPVGRGQLLSGVRRQKQDQSHSDKQSEYQTLHGLPSFWLAPRQAQACNEKRQPCKFKLAHALRTVHWRRGDMAAVSLQFIAEAHLPTRLADNGLVVHCPAVPALCSGAVQCPTDSLRLQAALFVFLGFLLLRFRDGLSPWSE